MKLTLLSILCALSLSLLPISKARAIVDPRQNPNNHIGIHIIDENDIPRARDLVNSNGGQWGYVTLVIRSDDRDQKKWQAKFDALREAKLIPLVRLATTQTPNGWSVPKPQDAAGWVDFFNSLNWVVSNRYVILFNEPNHATEWGGSIKPGEYAQVVESFAKAFKESSQDYYILNAGFDLAAPNSASTMEVTQYWKFMRATVPQVFEFFDGWASHSYPNPGFSGKVTDSGKMSIQGYQFELNFLSDYGLKPNLPIFITETGWIHHEGDPPGYGNMSVDRVAQNLTTAFEKVWTDSNIIAITPFVLNYPQAPFTYFSFFSSSGTPFETYHAMQRLSKVAGSPVQHDNSLFENANLPDKLVTNSHYHIELTVQNTGQKIWDDSYALVVTSPLAAKIKSTSQFTSLKPFQKKSVSFQLDTPSDPGSYPLNLQVYQGSQPTGQTLERSVNVIPPPSLIAKAQLWYQRVTSGSDFRLLIYNEGNLLAEYFPFTVTNGQGELKEVRDIVPGRTYRFVLVKPYYLPRQTHSMLNADTTTITFNRLLPLDTNADGAFSWKDFLFGLLHPIATLKRFLP